MKKPIFLLTALFMFTGFGACVLPNTSLESIEPTEGLMYELNADGQSYRVSSYQGDDAKVVIPDSYNDLPVT